MLFVALCKARGGGTRERTARRLEWKYPEGMRVIGEYWLAADDPVVVTIAEADSYAPLMRARTEWDDFFETTIFPAVTAEEGMQLARQMSQQT